MAVKSILVYITSDPDSALGENVCKLPMLLALSEGFPEAKISWVPGTSGGFFLANHLAPLVGGRIHEYITDLAIPTDPWGGLVTRHPILKRRFDLIIDTQRYLGRTLFLRRIPHGTFISDNWRYALSDRAPPAGLSRHPPNLVDKLVGLAATALGHRVSVANPIPVPEGYHRRAAEILPAGPDYVGIAPAVGNRQGSRDWRFEGFMAVGAAQEVQGRVPVVILGPGDLDMVPAVRAALPSAIIPDLGDAQPVGGAALTVALAGRLSAAVANDSGGGHLLAVGGAPMVSLFGWSRPAKRAPFARALVVLRSQTFGSEDVRDIPVEAVLDAVDSQVSIGPVAR